MSKRTQSSSKNDEWKPSSLLKVRRVLHVMDEEEIKQQLLKYCEMFEMFSANYPDWDVHNTSDWSIAVALAPDWFGEALTSRINNTMLVSALLITVTTALLLYPPQYALPFDDGSKNDPNLSLFFWLASICNLLFVVSIISGIAFVENAMSRSYTEVDKMILISSNYYMLNIAQFSSVIGSLLFLPVVLVPTFRVFNHDDATTCTIITALSMFLTLYILLKATLQSGGFQTAKVKAFSTLLDDKTGRLKAEFFPPGTDYSVNYLKQVFAVDEVSSSRQVGDAKFDGGNPVE